MKFTLKRNLSIILSVLLCFAMIPIATITVSAATAVTVSDEATLRTDLQSSTAYTITLGADIILTAPIKMTYAYGAVQTVNLAGHTIIYNPGASYTSTSAISISTTVSNSNTLSISNSVPATGGIAIDTASNCTATFFNIASGNTGLTFASGTINIISDTETQHYNSDLSVTGSASFAALSIIMSNVNVSGNINSSTTTVFNGTVNCGTLGASASSATVGTTFNGAVNATTVKFNAAGNVKFNNSLTATTIRVAGVHCYDTVTADNVYLSNYNNTFKSIFDGVITANTDLVINSGTFNNTIDVKTNGVIVGGTFNYPITVDTGATLTVRGGTFTGVDYVGCFTANGTIELKAGTYSFDPTSYIGSSSTFTGVGPFTVKTYNCTVNDVPYYSLSEAQTAANSGDTIKLTDDVYASNLTGFITVTKDNITLDLRGYAITDYSEKSYTASVATTPIIVNGGLTFNIDDSIGGGILVSSPGDVANGGGGNAIIRCITATGTTTTKISIKNVTLYNTFSEGNNTEDITLYGNTTSTDNSIYMENVTLLNNQTLGINSTNGSGAHHHGVCVYVQANVTIKNCNLDSPSTPLLIGHNDVTVNVTDSTLNAYKGNGTVDIGSFKNVTFTATNSVIKNTTKSSLYLSGSSTTADLNQVITLNNTTTSGNIGFSIVNTTNTYSKSITVNINNSKINNNTGLSLTGSKNTVTFNDSTIVSLSNGIVVSGTAANNTLEIKNTTISLSSNSSNATAPLCLTSTGTGNIANVYNCNFDSNGSTAYPITNSIISAATTVNIYGGNYTYNGTTANTTYALKLTSTAIVNIYGGVFSNFKQFASVATTSALNVSNAAISKNNTTATWCATAGITVDANSSVYTSIAGGSENLATVTSWIADYKTSKNLYIMGTQSIAAYYDADGTTLVNMLAADSTSGNFTVATLPSGNSSQLVGWSNGNAIYQPNDTIAATANINLTALCVDIETQYGASVRMNAPTGLRYETYINAADYDAIQSTYPVVSITTGTLIVPTEYVSTSGAFTVDALTAQYTTSGYLNIVNNDWHNNSTASTDGSYQFYGSIVNIKTANYTREFSGVGYIAVTYLSNNELQTVYVYGNYSLNSHSRSIDDVAKAAYSDRSDTLVEGYSNYIAADANYSPYTSTQLASMSAYFE